MLTVGLSTSTVTVCGVEAVFGLPAVSVATPAGTLIVNCPLVVGVIETVCSTSFQGLEVHDVILAALPVRDTSEPTKPDTVSVKVIVTLNAPV